MSFIDAIKDFFGIGGFKRTPEGFLSWQHLLLVGLLLTTMISLAVFLGLKNRNKDAKDKNKVLIVFAILINSFELIHIIFNCVNAGSIKPVLHTLPLFICSIQLIAIPLAAFSKGRLKEAALDFVVIFGILGAIMGTIGAAQDYTAYPVLSYKNIINGLTHTISGFCSLYIMISNMISMKKKNIWITFCILFGFALAAFVANAIIDYNYMFLKYHDSTPYSIFYNLVNGNPVLYPMIVIGLFVLYIAAFYGVVFLIRYLKNKSKKEEVQSSFFIYFILFF